MGAYKWHKKNIKKCWQKHHYVIIIVVIVPRIIIIISSGMPWEWKPLHQQVTNIFFKVTMAHHIRPLTITDGQYPVTC